jgi:glycosyltransferase involved in cell wall biosynthesis
MVIITPVRNEEAYLPVTLACMAAQTLPPARWIIVDDGSSDGTGAQARAFAARHTYAEYLRLPDRGSRRPAQGVIEAFYEGYRRLGDQEYDVIAKFDGDLEFPPHTLERIAAAFGADPRLGVTGPTRYEKRRRDGGCRRVLVPRGFVGGPYKFYRKACFDQIGPLIPQPGWDGVDIARARMHGWNTGEIGDLAVRHLKPTGTAEGEGLLRASEKYGYVSYYMGGFFWYFALRAVMRSLEARNPGVGWHMLQGFLAARRRREPRAAADVRRQVRRMQLHNMAGWLGVLLGRGA